MKNQFKKLILVVIAFSAVTIVSAQATDKPNGKFYASYEDYVNHKPVKGVEVGAHSWAALMGAESVKVITGSQSDRKKIANLPYDFFTLDDELVMRHGNKAYLVLVTGPLCFYAAFGNNNDINYSEGLKGEFVSFSEGKFKKYLDKYGLTDAFKRDKPKRQMKDSVNGYFNKEIEWYIKYFKLLNEKMK